MSKAMSADVVVVGAGLGGILCGALLGREGYRVTILEKLAFPGGRYTSIDRNGFKVNTGAYAVGLHGRSGPLWRLLADLGAEIEVRETPPHHLWANGKDLALPEKGQLRAIVETLARDAKEAERLLARVRQALRWQEPSDASTVDAWLHQYTDNPLIHGFFDFVTRSMTGTFYTDFPAGEFFRLMRSFAEFGTTTAMPKNGQKTTMDNLLRLLERWKVDLRLEAKVERIVCTDGRVEGVVASVGGAPLDIVAPVVVSDVGPKETLRIAGEGAFDAGYVRQVQAVPETSAVVTVFGYDRPIIDAPWHVQILGWDRLTAAWEANHVWPGYAPAGKQNMITYSMMRSGDTKKELEQILAQCRAHYPALEKADVVATMVFKDSWPVLRARPSTTLGTRTPVYGLYLAGDAVNPSGLTCGEGIALSSPQIAADIRQRFPRGARQ